MKVWSKGLGKTELVMDFDGYTVDRVKEAGREGKKPGQEEVHIKGVIRDPVTWDFRITITKQDMPGLVWTALRWSFFVLFIKSFFSILGFGFRRVLGRRGQPGKEPA